MHESTRLARAAESAREEAARAFDALAAAYAKGYAPWVIISPLAAAYAEKAAAAETAYLAWKEGRFK